MVGGLVHRPSHLRRRRRHGRRFFTFGLSGPLPPKEMGVVLGVAVLPDAALVRLLLLPVLLRLTGRAAWAKRPVVSDDLLMTR